MFTCTTIFVLAFGNARKRLCTKHEKCLTYKELNLCLIRLSSFYQSISVCVVVAAAAVLGLEGWEARARTCARASVWGGGRTRYLGITIFKQLHY